MNGFDPTLMLLGNQIQYYDWGGLDAIGDFLGKTRKTDRSEAEMWMGAHPKAPSWVAVEKQPMPLPELIADRPEAILGDEVAERFHSQLPFLMKLLVAARPLSIQAHPDATQAQDGFRKEEADGPDIDDERRNYKDSNHKPEVICALTDFWALKGFRPVGEMLADFAGFSVIQPELDCLRNRAETGPKEFFQSLTRLNDPRRQELVGKLVSAMRSSPHSRDKDKHAYWIVKLGELHPGDIGIACALMLNLVHLKAEQALYVPAGELHAYLEGMGVELMATSDNVLRAGLTSKHVDIDELQKVLGSQSEKAETIECEQRENGEVAYPSPAHEFELSLIRLNGSRPYVSGENRSVEILFVTEGSAQIAHAASGEMLSIPKGRSVLVPAAVDKYEIIGKKDAKTTIYKATVPRSR
ncbi:MAG: mannose-6-phosphate isomerase, class I [Pirellulaceae bacterium]|nr:mannose-6-phosphate isomerase, class I [Pirellulaceae bacterium]